MDAKSIPALLAYQTKPHVPWSPFPTTPSLKFTESVFALHILRKKCVPRSWPLRQVCFTNPCLLLLILAVGPHGRALRLSMIQSAQVFSPAPSNDPRVNLRILQTPLKNTFKSPFKPGFNPSPLKSRIAASSDDEEDEDEDQDEDEEEEEIVLVETNHPRVVEEEQDLVIMEDVPETVGPQVGTRVLFEAPRTPPRRRSMASNALHRAVLIRSAQRAVLRAEKEREEVEEELEVMDAVVDEDVGEEEPFGDDNQEPGDVEMASPSESEESSDGEEGQSEPQQPTWRKSLGKIWPFSRALSEVGCYVNSYYMLTLTTEPRHEPDENS